MQGNQTRTLWISVGAALLAIFLLYSWSQEQKTSMAKKFGATKRVVIASQDIAEMETIDESKLDYVEQPVDFIQPLAISEPEGAVGQVAAVPIKKGEQLLQTKLLLPGAETGLSMEISPGKRGIALPVDDIRGVTRLLKPGDRIDIIAALDYGKGTDARREVRTILQDVVVLATGLNVVNKIPRRFELDGNGKTVNRINLSANVNFSTITVEAKPEDAQQLVYILATSPGSLFTVLRHPNDRLQAPTRITTVEDVLGKPQLSRLPAAAPIALPSVQTAPMIPATNPAPQFTAPQRPTQRPTSLPKKRTRYEDL
ncbi:MAG: Flp pilus assembly protein CpaB [Proteobacteria bacterium]|nr:MAG: Flp pilus assembly protein CpaB [Pseudomonadota bacterium]